MKERKSISLSADGSGGKRIKLFSRNTVDLSRFDRNAILHIASFLSAIDLAYLGRTCTTFGVAKDGWPQRSLADEAAHQNFKSTATDVEKNALQRYDDESDTALLRQLYLLREPLEFKQIIGNHIYYISEESKSTISMQRCSHPCCAISNLVMRRGKHFVTFNVSQETGGYYIDFGVIRPLPGWDQRGLESFDPVTIDLSDILYQELVAERTERWGISIANCCSYNCRDGLCYWSNWYDSDEEQWEGAESLSENGTIGLLLDLDEGSMTVYKNKRRLGVIMRGLSGEYCWYTSVSSPGDTVSIERGPLP